MINEEGNSGEKVPNLVVYNAQKDKKLDFHPVSEGPEEVVLVHVVDANFYLEIVAS